MKITRRLIIILSVTLLLVPAQVFAINGGDQHSLNYDSEYYWADQTFCSTASSGDTTATVTGSAGAANAKTAFDFLRSNGYSAEQAAGIDGNLLYESGHDTGDVNPVQWEVGGGGGYGIAQFTPPTAMIAWVTAKGEDPNSLQGQLDYIAYVLSSGGIKGIITSTQTVNEATAAFETKYERPKDPAPTLSQREADANAILAKYSSDPVQTAASTGTTCSCNGSDTPANNTDGAHTIVLDPGHAPNSNELVDPATNEPVFDYENDPEMANVWNIAQDLQTKLQTAGYTVLITKNSLTDSSTNLKARAEVGNSANAALGVSLHSTPGSPTVGNDVFYPNVGDYLVKVNGQHDVYSDQKLASTDQADAQKMAGDLTQAEPGATFRAGSYDQLYGPITRTKNGVTMQGTMLVTQYFATVPWVYVEQYQDQGNGVTSTKALQDYEAGVLKGIEDVVPPPNGQSTTGPTAGSGSCAETSCAQGSTPATGDARILCEAEKYNGLYYRWGGGHQPYATFVAACPDPTHPPAQPPNQPHGSGGPDDGNPNSCATDCSGLVSVAVDAAFNLSFSWTVAGAMQGDGAQYWKQIPIGSAQAGDIVTTPEHVEIVEYVKGNTIQTFGSHQTGTKTSDAPLTTAADWPGGAWHWTGPGST